MKTDQNDYLLVVQQKGKSLFLLKEQLKELGGVYNDVGYIFPIQNELAVNKLIEPLDIKSMRLPLGEGTTFEDMKSTQKGGYFTALNSKLIMDLVNQLQELNINESTEEAINDSKATDEKKEELIELLNKIKRIESSLEWSEKMEEAVSKSEHDTSKYQELLEPITEQQIIEEIRNTSHGIKVGLKIGGVDIALPGGAITVCAAPTSHGKTTVLINLALGVLKHNPSKSIYFFTYEENISSIVSLFLNSYMKKDISKDNRNSITSYFREGECKYITDDRKELFKSDKNYFFESLMSNGRLNVRYSDRTAEELCKSISFLKENKPDTGAIFIDYIQLLYLYKKTGNRSRQEELKQVCLMLKDCAVETGLPIILAAQFNRQVTCEADLSAINIGEAGDIERIACLILGFWNRMFLGYTKEGNVTKLGDKITTQKPEIYMEVLKGRKIGAGHNSVLTFDGNQVKVENKICEEIRSFGDA